VPVTGPFRQSIVNHAVLELFSLGSPEDLGWGATGFLFGQEKKNATFRFLRWRGDSFVKLDGGFGLDLAGGKANGRIYEHTDRYCLCYKRTRQVYVKVRE
jgi:hypothetical protein